MGVAEKIGKNVGKAVSKFGIDIGTGFKDNIKPMMDETVDHTPKTIKDIDAEVAIRSIDEKMFRTKEFQELVKEMKERVKTSPEGLADWFKDTLGGVFEGFYDILIGVVMPSEIKDFSDAKKGAGYLTFICVDVVVLVSVLDIISTAISITLIRNMVHIGRLFIGTFGLDRYVGAVIAPALAAGLAPQLRYGFNEQYLASIPGSGDLIRMELREVFRPEYREELIFEGTSSKFSDTMKKHGFSDYWSDSYWAAHWILPSFGDLDEMLHRGIIDLGTWKDYVRRNDYLPAMIDKREKIIYHPYTRVDARRMWDMAVLDDIELKRAYLDQGYDAEHADGMTMWTKIYVTFPDLVARFKYGWISKDDVLREIIALGMKPERARVLFETKFKSVSDERVTKERDLTKSEIIKGVKKGVITTDDAVELLMDMGYDEDEAWYIITINIEALAGSPEKWSEYQELVNKHRLAVGKPVKKIPANILELEQRIKKTVAALTKAKKAKKPREKIDELKEELKALRSEYRRLIKEYHIKLREMPWKPLRAVKTPEEETIPMT